MIVSKWLWCGVTALMGTYQPADVRVKFVPVDMKGVPTRGDAADAAASAAAAASASAPAADAKGAASKTGLTGPSVVEEDVNQYTSLTVASLPAVGDKCFSPGNQPPPLPPGMHAALLICECVRPYV